MKLPQPSLAQGGELPHNPGASDFLARVLNEVGGPQPVGAGSNTLSLLA